jgi:hypothetical protein
MRELLKLFDGWKHTKDLPEIARTRATAPFKKIRAAFAAERGRAN